MADMNEGNLGPCQALGYVFGIGAESRHTYPVYPDPFRFITTGNEVFRVRHNTQ